MGCRRRQTLYPQTHLDLAGRSLDFDCRWDGDRTTCLCAQEWASSTALRGSRVDALPPRAQDRALWDFRVPLRGALCWMGLWPLPHLPGVLRIRALRALFFGGEESSPLVHLGRCCGGGGLKETNTAKET